MGWRLQLSHITSPSSVRVSDQVNNMCTNNSFRNNFFSNLEIPNLSTFYKGLTNKKKVTIKYFCWKWTRICPLFL